MTFSNIVIRNPHARCSEKQMLSLVVVDRGWIVIGSWLDLDGVLVDLDGILVGT